VCVGYFNAMQIEDPGTEAGNRHKRWRDMHINLAVKFYTLFNAQHDSCGRHPLVRPISRKNGKFGPKRWLRWLSRVIELI